MNNVIDLDEKRAEKILREAKNLNDIESAVMQPFFQQYIDAISGKELAEKVVERELTKSAEEQVEG